MMHDHDHDNACQSRFSVKIQAAKIKLGNLPGKTQPVKLSTS